MGVEVGIHGQLRILENGGTSGFAQANLVGADYLYS